MAKERVYRWVKYIKPGEPDEKLYNVGILTDGSLYNPNDYPPDKVRKAVEQGDERRHQRRSTAAKKAAQTRKARMEKRVYEVSQRVIKGHVFGPAKRCTICGKKLDDPESIERGIGSDCWQRVMSAIERMKTPQPISKKVIAAARAKRRQAA